MDLLTFSETRLQRAVHRLLADPGRWWEATDGTRLQIVAAGRLNVHEGPDLLDVAVLFDGVILIGSAEFHTRSSDWSRHGHSSDPRYGSVLLHVVLQDDAPPVNEARWTLVLAADDVAAADRIRLRERRTVDIAVEELQHFALLRLLRQTADAAATIRRLGKEAAITAIAREWAARIMTKRRRPHDELDLGIIAKHLPEAPLGRVVLHFSEADPNQLFPLLERAERARIAGEGAGTRRELLTNVILPLLCAVATPEQRVVLFQWYWSVRAAHGYGHLRRRFPSQAQDHVWQQQGMLEYLRHHGNRVSTCADAIREYGLDPTLQFLRAEPPP